MSYTDLILHAGYSAGYIIIFSIIFAESGLLIGFFLPGDTLLFSLGILASKGTLDLTILLIVACAGAIIGDSVGYATGRRFGSSLFKRKESRFFKPEYLQKAEAFYEVHGKKTIVLSRFVPIVRTFAPIVAGISKMNYPTFLFYNIIGGIFWVFTATLLGYFLGSKIPNAEHYTTYAVLAVIVLSFVPAFLHLRKK